MSTGLTKPQTKELLNIEAARDLLAKSRDLGQIRGIRDKAEAIRAYRQAQGDGLAAQNAAALIKLLAERRLGALLAERATVPGPGRGKKGAHDGQPFAGTTNAALGIDHHQAARDRAMARGRMLSTTISLSEQMADLASDTHRLLATWMLA